MWINDIADPLHFGYWGGLTTKIIWFFFGLGISSLVLSGIWVALKRKAISAKNRNTKALGLWKYINWAIYCVMMYYMYSRLIIIYSSSITVIIAISFGWILFIGLAYYIFVYRIGKVIKKEI